MIPTLSDALAARGYDTLTPVQEAVTDPDLLKADLLVSAQTGSGKTVGFGLAIAPTLMGDADRLGPAAAPLALVVAPTRELALQVMRELGWLYAGAGARVVSCVGGMDMRDERRALERGAHIVVGTPGRLRDHIQRGSLDMEGLRAVVLDEADEMLDLGFREDLEFMLAAAPEDRRTLMFSATVPQAIAGLAAQYQRDAVRVTTLSGTSQHADIAYRVHQVAQQDAENAIINVLRFHDAQNAIVFANTRAAVSRLTARFANRGFAVVSLSGELSQTERTHALQAMRDGRARVCVATDVAARGIDLPNLELVIHADLPSNSEGLLHRSGRTGRAGRKGISALIVTPKTAKKASRLLKFAKITADWTAAPGAEEILRRDEERLLDDPAWDTPPTEEERAFAAKLLARQTPEQIAAAFLRLDRARHSAPEILAAPDARPARAERAPFGPAAWVALSVGRGDRAEPRWILPLLCRAGDLTKEEIGAIRVQETETFVELKAASLDGFIARIGADRVLEDGISVRPLDAAPDTSRAPRPAAPKPKAMPEPQPSQENPPVSAPAPASQPVAQDAQTAPPHQGPADLDRSSKPKAAPQKARDKPRSTGGKRPDAPRKDHKARPPAAGGPRKPNAGKPSAGKSIAGKAGPAKGFKGKPAAPKRPRADASDTSKRFERPGGPGKPGKPGKPKPAGPGFGASKPGGPKRGKPAPRRSGGNEPPRRGNR